MDSPPHRLTILFFPLLRCGLFLLCLGETGAFAQVFEIRAEEKWGFMDREGQIVVPPQYEFLFPAVQDSPELGYYIFQRGEKFGLYQTGLGEIIPAEYESLQLQQQSGEYLLEFQQGGKVGIMNLQQEVLIPATFSAVIPLEAGLFQVKGDSLWGLQKVGEGMRIPFRFRVVDQYRFGMLVVHTDSGYSVWDSLGQPTLTHFPDRPRILSPDLLAYQAGGVAGRMGVIRTNGQEVYPPELMQVTEWEGQLRLEEKDLEGLLSLVGQLLLPVEAERIQLAKSGLFWVRKSENWGLIDTSGNWLLEPVLSRQGIFTGPVGKVTQGRKIALINQQGVFLTDFDCDQIRIQGSVARLRRGDTWTQLTFDETGNQMLRKSLLIRQEARSDSSVGDSVGQLPPRFWEADPTVYGWFLSEEEGLWGWRDSTLDSVMIPPTFAKVYPIPRLGISMTMIFPDNYGDHQRNLRRCGLVDHRIGATLLPPLLDMIYVQDFANQPVARAQFSTGGFVLVSNRGDIFKTEFTRYIDAFSGGIARACRQGNFFAPFPDSVGQEPAFDPHQLDGKWSFLNWRGKWGETPAYEYATSFQHQLALAQLDGKWGAVNPKLASVIPFAYDSLYFPRTATMVDSGVVFLCAEVQAKRFFLLNAKGKLLHAGKYEAVENFSEGLAAFSQAGKWGYLDTTGQVVISPQFDRAGPFQEGVAPVRSGRFWGYIDREGSWMVRPQFTQASTFSHGLGRVREGRRFGYLRKDGSWLFKTIFVEASDFQQGAAIVRKPDKQFGLIDRRGRWILPQKYEEIKWVGNQLQLINDKELTGFATADGKILVPPTYEFVSPFHEGMARVKNKKTELFGYLNADFQEAIVPTYLSASHFEHGLAVVWREQDGKRFCSVINAAGEALLPFENLGIQILGYGRLSVNKVDETFAGWRKLDIRNLLPPQALPQSIPELSEATRQVIETRYGYQQLREQSNGFFLAETDTQLGLLRTDGSWLVEPEYETISFRDGLYKLISGNQIGYLTESGKWVWHPQFGTQLPEEARE